MKTTHEGKRFVALSAAVAIGMSGVAATVPALASTDAPDDLGVVAAEALTANVGVAAVGYNAEGDIAVQVVEGSEADEDRKVKEKTLEGVNAFAKAETGAEPVVTTIENGYYPASANDVVGGAGYAMADAGADRINSVCSFGFPATGPNGEEAILTAGHCVDEGNDIYLEQPSASNAGTGDYEGEVTTGLLKDTPIGTVTHSAWADTTIDPNNPGDWTNPDNYDPAQTQDYGVITLDDDSLTTHPQVTDWTTSDSDDLFASTKPVAGVHDVTTEDVGKSMWRSGRTSATQEGTVGPEYQGQIGGVVDGYTVIRDHDGTLVVVYGFAAEALGIPGDSGGSVMMGDQAVGVLTGTNYNTQTGEGGDWIWVAELAEGLKHLPGEYTVKTVEDEEPEPTEDPTEDPTEEPTEEPTDDPTEEPTEEPTDDPTEEPTEDPTDDPTEEPTEDPTDDPTEDPTDDPTETPEPTETGEPTSTPTATDSPDPTPTATETDDEDVDPALAIDPQEIAAERFVADGEEQAIEDDRGVTYTVTDVEPGSEVTFDTYMDADPANAGSAAAPAADAADEPAKSITVTADEDGTATSRVWGETTAAPSAYIGEYDVVATTEDETLEGSFSVVDGSGDGDGGQDDGGNGDDGDNGDDLPRTGSTTAPLVAGAAGLVALGGALVYVARRRQA
jgi:LPXTG-motif cell wall-anchored protein